MHSILFYLNMKKLLTKYLIILVLTTMAFENTNSQTVLTDSTKIEEYKKTAKLITASALQERKGYNWLKELCEIGPRLSGSENSLKAIDWAFYKMKSIGLDTVWLQQVIVPHWERGTKEECRIVKSEKFKDRKLEILALGNSIGTPEDGITAEILEVKSFKELEEKKQLAKNRIVFFNRKLDQSFVNTFRGYGSAVNQRVQGAIEAAKYGAVGVIVRSVTTKYDNVPHTGVMNYADTVKKIPAAAIGFSDADFLTEALKEEPNLKLNFKMNCKTLPDAESYNVIGEIKGSEFPDEVIVVGGHFDSWDVGCGAHDDGAGCVQSLEVLYLLKKLNLKPKRTIRCVFFINEENGTRGAKQYGKFADASGEIHYAAIESDRGAFTPLGFTVETDSVEILNLLNSWLPVLEEAKIDWIKKGGSGVDIRYIKNAKLLLGYFPDTQRYMDLHHSANDIFEAVHPREFELGAAAIAIMAYLLSEAGI